MDTEHVNHLQTKKSAHLRRLRNLELRKAQLGLNCPPETHTEIEEIKQEIASIERQLNLHLIRQLPQQDQEEEEYTVNNANNSISDIAKENPIATILVIVAILALFSWLTSPTTLISDTFDQNSGLGAWRSRGIATFAKDGRENDSALKGSVQLQGAPVSFIYQILSGKATIGHTYTAEAWCKASVGSRCKIFVGNIEEGVNPPSVESDRLMIRDGTGNWESMRITFMIEKEEQIAIFLYAEGEGSVVLYDNVQVTRK